MADTTGADPGGTDPTEVAVVPRAEYDAMVAELAELRPLRSDLIAIRSIVTSRPL